MAQRVISIINQKGGVGKTTTAVTLAAGLLYGLPADSHKARGDVLLVDLDPQAHATQSLGHKRGIGVSKLLLGQHDGDLHKICAHHAQVRDGPGLWVAPSGVQTAMAATELLADLDKYHDCLRRSVRRRDLFDWVIIDTPPSADVLFSVAMAASEAVLIVTRLDWLGVLAVHDTLFLMSLCAKRSGMPSVIGILPTFWERRSNTTIHQLARLRNAFDMVWPPIPEDVKAREAPEHGQSLWQYAFNCRAMQGNAMPRSNKRIGGYADALSRLVKATS